MERVKFKGATSIADKDIVEYMKEPKQTCNVVEFLQCYREWMQKDHNLDGINNFPYLSFANGSTEVFDKFYLKHMGKRLRLFRGEYYYHRIAAREWFNGNFAWVDEDSIKENDVLVVSVPFSDTGNIPENYFEVLTSCYVFDVPVLIDMAYLNITKNFNIYLGFDCIETIATSLSKVFPVQHHRIGMRLNREHLDDPLDAYTDQDYVNHTSINMGYHLINKFSNSYTYDKYLIKQKKICQDLDVEESSCVIFGIDKKNLHPKLNRGGNTNRLCFSRLWGD